MKTEKFQKTDRKSVRGYKTRAERRFEQKMRKTAMLHVPNKGFIQVTKDQQREIGEDQCMQRWALIKKNKEKKNNQ